MKEEKLIGLPSRLHLPDEVGEIKLRGHHADMIITDYPPTKWQKFILKINPFASKEKKRVYKWFEEMEAKHFTGE